MALNYFDITMKFQFTKMEIFFCVKSGSGTRILYPYNITITLICCYSDQYMSWSQNLTYTILNIYSRQHDTCHKTAQLAGNNWDIP